MEVGESGGGGGVVPTNFSVEPLELVGFFVLFCFWPHCMA